MTLHFLLQSLCLEFSNSFKKSDGYELPPDTGEACSSCGKVVSKIVPTFAEPPALLQELLISSSAEGRHLRNNIRLHKSALAMATVRAEFVSNGLGVSKYNPIIAVHGRMYQEIAAL